MCIPYMYIYHTYKYVCVNSKHNNLLTVSCEDMCTCVILSISLLYTGLTCLPFTCNHSQGWMPLVLTVEHKVSCAAEQKYKNAPEWVGAKKNLKTGSISYLENKKWAGIMSSQDLEERINEKGHKVCLCMCECVCGHNRVDKTLGKILGLKSRNYFYCNCTKRKFLLLWKILKYHFFFFLLSRIWGKY